VHERVTQDPAIRRLRPGHVDGRDGGSRTTEACIGTAEAGEDAKPARTRRGVEVARGIAVDAILAVLPQTAPLAHDPAAVEADAPLEGAVDRPAAAARDAERGRQRRAARAAAGRRRRVRQAGVALLVAVDHAVAARLVATGGRAAVTALRVAVLAFLAGLD